MISAIYDIIVSMTLDTEITTFTYKFYRKVAQVINSYFKQSLQNEPSS